MQLKVNTNNGVVNHSIIAAYREINTNLTTIVTNEVDGLLGGRYIIHTGFNEEFIQEYVNKFGDHPINNYGNSLDDNYAMFDGVDKISNVSKCSSVDPEYVFNGWKGKCVRLSDDEVNLISQNLYKWLPDMNMSNNIRNHKIKVKDNNYAT